MRSVFVKSYLGALNDPKITVANVLKLFTAISYAFSQLARAFVSGKPFQPSLMFGGKARSLP